MRLVPLWTGALACARALTLALVLAPSLGCPAQQVELGRRSALDAALGDASERERSSEQDGADAASPEPDEREDEDEQRSDRPRTCSEATECTRDEPFCNLERGVCVECLRNADCTKPNERCESDGECDTPD